MHVQVLRSLNRLQRLRPLVGLWLVVSLTVGAPWLEAATYFVDDDSGNDSRTPVQAQSSGTPWKTITHALSVATSGDTINVASGTYDTANGETFPLEMKSGVAIIGAGAGSVTTVTITNDGTSAYATPPDVSFTGGGGVGAEGFAVINGSGEVTDVVVTSGGGGYTSAPTVVFSGGGGAGAAATAAIGPGASRIVSPDGTRIFFTDEALSSSSRLSGFLLTHDSPAAASDWMMEFAVGPFAMSPRIDGNAFVSDSQDSAIVYYDDSTSDGSFTGTIENNTFSQMYEGTVHASSGTAGGTGDNFSPTIRNNSFSSVSYPMNITLSSNQGGDVQPLMTGNTTWGSSNDFYLYASLGEDFDTLAPTVSNNTFRGAADDAFSNSLYFYSGTHTFSPTYSGNTITDVTGDGVYMYLSVDSDTGGGNQTITPTISGNTFDTIGGDGIFMSLDYVDVNDEATVTFSPSVTGNTMTGVSGDGLEVMLSELRDGNFVSNMTVEGNRIEDPGEDGIRADVTEFYDTDVDSMNFDWSISNNTVTGSTSGDGISLTISSLTGADDADASSMQVTMTGNTLDGNDGDGIYIFFSPDTASTIDSAFTVQGNTITDNGGSGIYLSFSSAANDDQSILILGNTVTGNGDDGLYVSLSTQSELETNTLRAAGNLFSQNGGWGVNVANIEGSPDPMIFECNTITGNTVGGVYIDSEVVSTTGGGAGVNFGDSTTTSPGHNAIHSNGGSYDFHNENNAPVKAENNWWGSTDPGTIDARIYDDQEGGRGAVDFEPFLTAASQITKSITADVEYSALVDDADSSGSPSVGDTLRFCSTVTAGGNCGTGQAVTLVLPIPPNTTLVDGSVTTDNGVIEIDGDTVLVKGVVLEPGASVNVCLDVVADSGTAVTQELSADGPDVTEASDSATVNLGAAAVLTDVPTTTEWGLIAMSLLLLLAGLFAMRRGGLAVMLVALMLAAAVPSAEAKQRASKGEARLVTIAAVSSAGGRVTLRFGDGTSVTVDEEDLEIREARSRNARRQHASASSATRAASPQAREKKGNRTHHLDAAALAERLGHGAQATGAQSAIVKVRRSGDTVQRVKVSLYASPAEASEVLATHPQKKSTE